jgi:hypothetical protein
MFLKNKAFWILYSIENLKYFTLCHESFVKFVLKMSIFVMKDDRKYMLRHSSAIYKLSQ